MAESMRLERHHEKLQRMTIAESVLKRATAVEIANQRSQQNIFDPLYDGILNTEENSACSEDSSLRKENDRLRVRIMELSRAVSQIQINADLKVTQLKSELLKYKELYELERAHSSRLTILNENLSRRQQQQQQQNVEISYSDQEIDEDNNLWIAETHLNELIASKIRLTKENCKLRKQLLNCCETCRRSGETSNNNSIPTEPPQRPTYQSSARRLMVLETLPKRPVLLQRTPQHRNDGENQSTFNVQPEPSTEISK